MLRQIFVPQHPMLGNGYHVDELCVLDRFSSRVARGTRRHRIHYAKCQTDDEYHAAKR